MTELKNEKQLLSDECNRLKEEVVNQKTIQLENENKYKTEEQKLRQQLNELNNKYENELRELKKEMSETKDKNDLIIDKLYKQLDLRETQLDDSLMAVECSHNQTAQELLEQKSDKQRLNKLIEELEERNRLLNKELEDSKLNFNSIQSKNKTNDKKY